MNKSKQPSNNKQAVSLLIHHEVLPDFMNTYEAWLKKVIDVASAFMGPETGINIRI